MEGDGVISVPVSTSEDKITTSEFNKQVEEHSKRILTKSQLASQRASALQLLEKLSADGRGSSFAVTQNPSARVSVLDLPPAEMVYGVNLSVPRQQVTGDSCEFGEPPLPYLGF